MRHEGTITVWHPEKGVGFIRPDDGTQNVFAHIKSFQRKDTLPQVGMRVAYTLALDKQTRLQAQRITIEGERRSSIPRKGLGTALAILLYAAAIGVLLIRNTLSIRLAVIPALLSTLTYLIYAQDKRAALSGGRRWPENTLHLLALLGGWPGALLAQHFLRHKSSKQSFKILFYLTVLIHCTTLIWLAC